MADASASLRTPQGSANLVGAREMYDSPQERGQYDTLPLLQLENAGITKIFLDNDSKAVRYRTGHKVTALIALGFGSLAILVAIFELAITADVPGATSVGPSANWWELVFAFVAGVAISGGLLSRCKDKWLLSRHKATLCTQLKFGILTQPDIWFPAWDSKKADAKLDEKLKTVTGVGDPRREGEASAATTKPEAMLPEVFDFEDVLLPRETLRQLTEYYWVKRLLPQKEYLDLTGWRNQLVDSITHRASVILFILTLAAVTAHFFLSQYAGAAFCKLSTVRSFLERAGFACLDRECLPKMAVLLAASLPVLAMLVRAVRGAFEYSRNRRRFQMAAVELLQRGRQLLHEGLSQSAAPSALQPDNIRALPVLLRIWACENILKEEHREWLTLMHDAEWFV